VVQNSSTLTLLNAATLTGTFGNIASGARLQTSDGVGSFIVSVSGTQLTLSQFLLNASTYLWSGGDLVTAGNVTPSLLPSNTVPTGGHLAIFTTADHNFASQSV